MLCFMRGYYTCVLPDLSALILLASIIGLLSRHQATLIAIIYLSSDGTHLTNFSPWPVYITMCNIQPATRNKSCYGPRRQGPQTLTHK